jgi:hypothetical protein
MDQGYPLAMDSAVLVADEHDDLAFIDNVTGGISSASVAEHANYRLAIDIDCRSHGVQKQNFEGFCPEAR